MDLYGVVIPVNNWPEEYLNPILEIIFKGPADCPTISPSEERTSSELTLLKSM